MSARVWDGVGVLVGEAKGFTAWSLISLELLRFDMKRAASCLRVFYKKGCTLVPSGSLTAERVLVGGGRAGWSQSALQNSKGCPDACSRSWISLFGPLR